MEEVVNFLKEQIAFHEEAAKEARRNGDFDGVKFHANEAFEIKKEIIAIFSLLSKGV